jgi:hypothetical protein
MNLEEADAEQKPAGWPRTCGRLKFESVAPSEGESGGGGVVREIRVGVESWG